MKNIGVKVNLGEPIDLDNIVLVPLIVDGKTFKMIKLLKNEDGKFERIDLVNKNNEVKEN